MIIVRLKDAKNRRAFYSTNLGKVISISVLGVEVYRSKPGRKVYAATRNRPPLRGLVKFADLFSIGTRKAIKAMAGDYDVEVRRLRRERRPAMAKWNVFLAWGTALGIVLRSPLSFLIKAAKRLISGN